MFSIISTVGDERSPKNEYPRREIKVKIFR